MHYINRDKGKFYRINGCSLGHFYKQNFIRKIGRSLEHFYKICSLSTIKLFLSQFYFRFVLAQYNMVELSREECNLIVERRGIKKSQNMSTKKLINAFNRQDSKSKGKKLSKIGLGKVKVNQVNQAKRCKESQWMN